MNLNIGLELSLNSLVHSYIGLEDYLGFAENLFLI